MDAVNFPAAQPVTQKRKQGGRHLQLQHTTQLLIYADPLPFQFISGNVCPSPPDGPAGDLQPTATLVHPGVNFSGECLGVGLPDDEVKYMMRQRF